VAGEVWPPRTSERGSATADVASPSHIVSWLGFGVFFPFKWWACCSGATVVGPACRWLSWCGGVCVLCPLSATLVFSFRSGGGIVSTTTLVWLIGETYKSALPRC
jgi:hypothetical protein